MSRNLSSRQRQIPFGVFCVVAAMLQTEQVSIIFIWVAELADVPCHASKGVTCRRTLMQLKYLPENVQVRPFPSFR
jgi:hypothetical protein